MTEHFDTIERDNKAIQPHIDAIADYFKNYSGAGELQLQSGDVVISVRYGNTLDGLYNEKLLNINVKNDAAIEINLFIDKLSELINESNIDYVQIVAGLCGTIQAVCLKTPKNDEGLALYKQAIEKLCENSERQNFFDYFAHCVEWNRALLRDTIKGTRFDKQGASLIGFIKPSTVKSELKHQHTFAMYAGDKIKKCVDCGHTEPLFDLEIRHLRDNGY